MATATLPGGTQITVGNDVGNALQLAINSEFAKVSTHTANTVASGQAGANSYFNLVFNNKTTAQTLNAGTGVQAIIDIGKGVDSLKGGASTDLIVGNAAGDSISTGLTSGVASVFGGAGSDTLNVTGKAQAYLETGKNVVNLNGNDSISLLGTGGSDTVNITGGNNTVTAAYAATVKISASNASETLTLASKSTVSASGSSDTVTVTTEKSSLSFTGGSNRISVAGGSNNISVAGSNIVDVVSGSGDTITSSGAGTVTIAAANSADTVSYVGNLSLSLGTGDTVTLTGHGNSTVSASGSATVTGGSGLLTFTGSSGGRDSVQAGSGSATLTGGSKASDIFQAGSGTNYLFKHGVGGKDTFIGGAHSDTMVGAGADKTGTDLFKFESSAKGGVHTIQSFTHGKDTIDLVGYTQAQLNTALQHATFKGGVETITLSDHTTIKITGLKAKLVATDFKIN